MDKQHINFGKRFSGLDWATEIRDIILVGVGGIGSWTALSLSRIGHSLVLVDGDRVDETNVGGGQLFRREDIGRFKPVAVSSICRQFGCSNDILVMSDMFRKTMGVENICISGLDNMDARKLVYDTWKEQRNVRHSLLMDGRMNAELFELFTIQGDREDQMKEYEEKWLFNDEDIPDQDCTTKQTTFMAMQAAGIITATLCNWLTNKKIGEDFRSVPFYQRMYTPGMLFSSREIQETKILTETV